MIIKQERFITYCPVINLNVISRKQTAAQDET